MDCKKCEDAGLKRIQELEAEVARLNDELIKQSEEVQTNWASPFEKAGMKHEIKRLKVDAVAIAASGREPSDFMLSFPVVRNIWDLFHSE